MTNMGDENDPLPPLYEDLPLGEPRRRLPRLVLSPDPSPPPFLSNRRRRDRRPRGNSSSQAHLSPESLTALEKISCPEWWDRAMFRTERKAERDALCRMAQELRDDYRRMHLRAGLLFCFAIFLTTGSVLLLGSLGNLIMKLL